MGPRRSRPARHPPAEMGATVIALDVIFPESDRFQRVEPGRSDDTDAALAAALRRRQSSSDTPSRSTAAPLPRAGARPSRCACRSSRRARPTSTCPLSARPALVCSLPLLASRRTGIGLSQRRARCRRHAAARSADDRTSGTALSRSRARRGNGGHRARIPSALRLLNVNATSLVARRTRDSARRTKQSAAALSRDQRERFATSPRWTFWKGARRPRRSKNAIAIVGATALGTRDGVATPFDTVFPGVEVQATVADNLLRGDFISRPADARSLKSPASCFLE